MSTTNTADRSAPGALRPMVFIVDDEPLVAMVIKTCLAAYDYRTKVFSNAAGALEELRHTDSLPDLLITDYNMPGMTGLELIQQCNAIRPRLKIILCSGTVDESILASAARQPDKFISKPFSVDVLITEVKRLLQQA